MRYVVFGKHLFTESCRDEQYGNTRASFNSTQRRSNVCIIQHIIGMLYHVKTVDRINIGAGGRRVRGGGRTACVLIVDIRSTRPLFSPRVRGLMLTRQGTKKKRKKSNNNIACTLVDTRPLPSYPVPSSPCKGSFIEIILD